MDYKAMFEAVERKLAGDLELSQRFQTSYQEKGLDTSYLEGRISGTESAIIFAEELRRIYA